ncbi:MAG: hypothetical protein J5956_06695 [Ruminococcus sp.]|nr:hypothetical protein [Ruminococcus sp.]
MPDNEKKGITVKVDAQLHAQVREYIEAHGMTMSEFVAKALDSELHPSQTRGGVNMANRTIAFQVSEETFDRLKDYLSRHHMTQRQFVLGLIVAELDRDMQQTNEAEQQPEETEEEELDENEDFDEDEEESMDMSM